MRSHSVHPGLQNKQPGRQIEGRYYPFHSALVRLHLEYCVLVLAIEFTRDGKKLKRVRPRLRDNKSKQPTTACRALTKTTEPHSSWK